jgi:phosphoribosylformimino-5-aminoimidazole carboxamide ribotide isomerase
MLLIPAIDLRKGRCVRLVRGDLRDETVYSREPVSMAKLWQLKGARWLHVVDLDGAISGRQKNLKYVFDMVKAIRIPIQFGGGVRDYDTLRSILNRGVQRVILGTAAAQDKKLLQKAVAKFGNRIAVGIDAQDGKVAVKGWKEMSSLSAVSFAKEMEAEGVKTLIFTDIKKDGMMAGPNFKSIKEMAQAVKVPLVASGGVSSLKDIRNLRNLEKYGVGAAIIGKAIYTGAVDLKDAIKVADGEKDVAVKKPKKSKTPSPKSKAGARS